MPDEYRDTTTNIDCLNLDAKNPRFASYHNRINSSSISEADAIEYLLNSKKAKISELAVKIHTSKGLFKAEPVIVAEPQINGIYIVLEGNRRICACKVMKAIYNNEQHLWLTQEIKDSFPKLSQSNQSDKDFIDSLSNIKIGVYSDKDLAQPFIISKHNGGIEGWSSEEKNFNYYERYEEIKTANPAKGFSVILDEIVSLANGKKDNIRKAIRFYSVFDYVLTTLTDEDRKEVPPDVAFLPLVQVFMPHLCTELKCNGNKLSFNDETQKYDVPPERKETFNKILALIGKAFLIRKPSDNPSRISTTEMKKPNSPANVINEKRLAGLKVLIDEYNNIPVSNTLPTTTTSVDTPPSNTPTQPQNNNGGNGQGNVTTTNPPDDIYEPPTIYTPRQISRHKLGFTKAEYDSFVLDDANNDGDAKIRSIIIELSKMDVSTYQYACTMLYLHLLEAITRKIFDAGKIKANGVIKQFPENSLAGAIENVYGVVTLTDANRGAIKNNIKTQNLIKVLNDYKHNPKTVDTSLLISSWATMKEYIKACLTH